MKKLFAVLVCCLFVSAVSAQQTEHRPRREVRQSRPQAGAQELQQAKKYDGAHMRLEQPVYNFGDVERKGGSLEHDFRIVNDGSAPLVILRVETSCSCLKASFPKRPIPQGHTAMIRITYEPHKSEPGAFHKVIQVYSNSVDGRQIITVQGNSLDPNKM